ncbi:pyrroline-5-carboxylate reductase [Candidatus Vondammii sp. HM_W22]|uniref:pyrroline-5-carboxylate reductase n=1 Tax=Candidatus Vondammii sp. HM_W22 TaxID=2687299 RepID=UPI002A4E2D6F|nr:pyrroline-5-carboxylate reductase [Candidatus Vondammii sp. HM_W22]
MNQNNSAQLSDMSSKNIAFIGGGNMAASLIGGLVADGYNPKRIIASDPDGEKLASLAARFGVITVADNEEAVSQADVVVIAVKPQIAEQVARNLASAAQSKQPLIVSIVAGVRESDLQIWLGGDLALIRTMPNTPAMIQAGASVLHAGPGVSSDQKNLAESILRAVGLTLWVDNEEKMDAVTALSGSGPAYLFLVMESMEQAGIELGLPAESARLLTLQTALGAARMAMESSDGPATLRKKVTSPGGTTEAALAIMEQGGVRRLFTQALTGARDRSIELSKLLGNH